MARIAQMVLADCDTSVTEHNTLPIWSRQTNVAFFSLFTLFSFFSLAAVSIFFLLFLAYMATPLAWPSPHADHIKIDPSSPPPTVWCLRCRCPLFSAA